jgi:hypothetical protein
MQRCARLARPGGKPGKNAEPPTKTHRKRKMKTNSKAVRDQIRAHILENVTDGNGDTFPTLPEATSHLRSEFKRVAGYPANLKRFPNHQERFHDYLMGIPFDFEYENHRIKEFLNGLGINSAGKEYDAEKSARLYTCLIYKEIA